MMRRIHRAAVIGTSEVGQGIAGLLASAGVKTLLVDSVPSDLREEERKDPSVRNRIAKAGLESIRSSRPPVLMHRRDADLISIGNLEDDFQELSECDWIIEALTEDEKTRRALFARLEQVCKKEAIVSSCCFDTPLKRVAHGLGENFRARFLGTRFFHPVRHTNALEITPGEETSPEIIHFISDFAERFLGKDIQVVEDPLGSMADSIRGRHSDHVITLGTLKAENRVLKSCDSASLIDLGDGAICCELHSPGKVVNEEIIDFISRALDLVEKKGTGLVIGSAATEVPGEFSAGEDLPAMAAWAEEKRYLAIDTLLKKAQDTLQRVRYSGFPVVAAPFGKTLGTGCEICLAADRIVAHAELHMGLTEIRVGLLPASGGCTNLWKRFHDAIPEAVQTDDLPTYLLPPFRSIAKAAVSGSAEEARAMGFLGPLDRIVFHRNHLIGEAKREVLRMLDVGYFPPARRKIRVAGKDAQGMVNVELFDLQNGGFITEYDAFLARRIAFVMSGGEIGKNAEVDEELILKLERAAFVDFWKQEKTLARVKHMLGTGKPLRN
jgi:enoyl-CoA hydratase/carnithine racemase